MDKLWIAIDLDDVILDFGGRLREAIEVEFNVKIPEFNKWEMSEVMDPIIGQSWWDWLRSRPKIWATAKPVYGALGNIARLRRAGHHLEIVTSKPEWAELATWQWIGKWHPPVHSVSIVDLKAKKFQETEADLLIDDRPQSCYDWAADGRPALLYSQPHNRAFDEIPGVVRVKDWAAIMRVMEGPYLEWPPKPVDPVQCAHLFAGGTDDDGFLICRQCGSRIYEEMGS